MEKKAQPSSANKKAPLNPLDLLKTLKDTTEKKKKPTILDQANQDWKIAKSAEGLEDELKQATKSKDGYLDKQAFLDRSDHRRFEKEREIRTRQRALNKNAHV